MPDVERSSVPSPPAGIRANPDRAAAPAKDAAWPLFRSLFPGRPLLILGLTLGLYLVVLVPRLIRQNERNGLAVGHLHLWGDWPFHIAMIQRFATCPPDQWLAQHAMIGGEPLRYPFASSLISGMLMRLGFSLPAAILVPTLAAFAMLLPGTKTTRRCFGRTDRWFTPCRTVRGAGFCRRFPAFDSLLKLCYRIRSVVNRRVR